ncbi:MAG: hypothetical protein GY943_21210, partial [Chloroflexi bacterium]|nr:hypothetical protein [Chloroflexota bacterium]
MTPTMIAELEQELEALLPEWVEMEPQKWQQLQLALRRSQGVQPDFETFEAFLAWVDEDTSAEWDGGEVVFMSPASTRHQLIVGFL